MLNKEELIKKFLDNRCNEEEMRVVMELLNAEPTLIDEMLSKSEWDNIDVSLQMIPGLEIEMKEKIFSRTQTPIRKIAGKAIAIAAVLAGLVLGLFIFDNYRSKSTTGQNVAKKVQPVSTTEKIENTQIVTREIMLADKSTVILYPGSSIEFNRDFTGNRTIQLTGKAIFNVTKILESPFVVFSGAVRTTALGTRFLVDNMDPANRINVKLYHGKVVVQAIEEMISSEKTFLDAGEQCFVDVQTMQVQIAPLYAPKINNPLAQRAPLKADENAGNEPATKVEETLHFTQTVMPEVFEKLQEVFNRPIQFNRDEVEERYFTGSFSINDSLSVILRMISMTSDLKISSGDDGIILVQNITNLREVKIADSLHDLGISAKIRLEDLAPEPDFTKVTQEIDAVPQIVVINSDEVSYNRISLPDLFQELQKKTKKTIHYNREEVDNINFTGSILYNVNMRNTLSMICSINGLTLQVKQGSYYIKKEK